jgi:hypothetical protein
MSDIVLSGDDLRYWRKKAELVDTLTELSNSSDRLVLTREMFSNFNDNQYELLRKLLHSRGIKMDKVNHKQVFFNNKNLTMEDVENVLDFIMFETTFRNRPRNPEGLVRAVAQRVAPRVRNNNFSNYNNNNNNSYNNAPSKKNKYKSNITINNNNTRKPYGKTKHKRKYTRKL